MRQEFILGDTTNLNVTSKDTPNTFNVHLWWKPAYVIVLNNTSNPFFMSEGRAATPTATNYDTPVPAGSPLQLPTNANEFAGFLPLTPALSDLTAVVKIIFES